MDKVVPLAPLFTWRSALCDSTLTATTRHVLLALSLHMNERGESCWPSQRTLAKETGRTAATVNKHLKLAEELGWIESYEMKRRGQGWKRHGYRPKVPDVLSQEEHERVTPEATRQGERVIPHAERVIPHASNVLSQEELSTSGSTAKSTPHRASPLDAYLEKWNVFASAARERHGNVATMRAWNTARRRGLTRFLKSGGDYDEVLAAALTNSHYIGLTRGSDGRTPWSVDFDWLFVKDNWIRAIEQSQKHTTNGRSSTDNLSRIRDATRAAESE